MAKNPTNTGYVTQAVAPEVMNAISEVVFESDVGPVCLADLSPAGAVHFLGYGIMQSTRDASAAVKARAQALALKAVLSREKLTDDDRKELERLEAAFDASVESGADKALLRTVARAFISAVAQQKGVKLTAKAVANGVETFMGPNGSKAPSYPALLRAYGLIKGVVVAAKKARLAACIDGSIGTERASRGETTEPDDALSDLGLFD